MGAYRVRMSPEYADDPSWKHEVLHFIRSHWHADQIFSLNDVYAYSDQLTHRHPGNLHAEAKIRQILQQLRDDGEITFVDNDGHYSPAKLVLPPGDPLREVSTVSLRTELLRIRDLLGQVVTSSRLQKEVQGFGSQKGIYKPSGSNYALWVRQTSKGIYPDEELSYQPDGSWTYRYAPEGRGGQTDLALDTNRSLMRCQEDHVPIGVFRQVSDVDGKTAYEVLGLAEVASFDGEYFVLRGEPIDVARTPSVERVVPTFQAFERDPATIGMVARIVRDQRFGVAVRRIYHEKCSLCNIGFRVGGLPIALDAAHIIPVQDGGILGDLRNGILLCKNHHALFDTNAWTMDEDLRVKVAPDRTLRESAFGNHVLSVEGKRLPNLPTNEANFPARDAIRWRVEQFHKAWA
jgi:hypothetical protein